MQTQYEVPTTDILIPEEFYTRADTSKRFANYLVDLVLFYVISFAIGIILALASPSFAESIADGEYESSNRLLDRLFTLVYYAVYMGCVEAIFKGKSLGKFFTKTRAVNLDGSRISVATAFARGFSRAVPFCVFSAFGSPSNPWQDRWTKTVVIEEDK